MSFSLLENENSVEAGLTNRGFEWKNLSIFYN